jgi:apolipoprotein N-acyltransferase
MTTVNPAGTRTYPAERHTETRTEKGLSLARGPALILGTLLLAVGLYLLYKARTFPPFSNFPNGSVTKDGNFLFGIFGANGWTGMLTAVGGGLLLFGAAQHLLAKTMSLIVGVALGAAAVIALISGNVLGMAAANGWTKLGWAACAVILLFNTLVPRRRRTVVVADEAVATDAYDRRPATATTAGTEATAVHRGVDEPVATRRDRELDEQPTVAQRERDLDGEPTVAHDSLDEPTAARRGDAPAEIHRD